MRIAKEGKTEFIPLIKMSYQLFFKISALLEEILLIEVLGFFFIITFTLQSVLF